MTGWKCYHYYHHIVTVELPYFTSICEEDKYKTLSATRRLSPEDFDHHGRILTHWPRKTYAFILPSISNLMRPGKHTIYTESTQSPNVNPTNYGNNGQLRIIDTAACADCNGFTFSYDRTAVANSDYWYYNIR